MKEEMIRIIDPEIEKLGLWVSDAKKVHQEGVIALEIELDSQGVLDLDIITKATDIINPILDRNNVIDEEIDVVDIYGKSKEEV